jgi:ACS family D-galactonate transporter-like MFS transporter
MLTTAMIMVCQSSQALALGGIALLLPLIRQDLGLTFAQAGMLSAASGLLYASMQIPSGYLADRWGPKRLYVAGVVGTNLMTLSFAMIDSYPLLLANQAISGLCRALIFAPGLLLMQAQFGEGRRSTASGLFIVGGSAFAVLLNLLGPMLVVPLGWRGLLICCALAILSSAIAYALLGTAPRSSGRAPLRLSELPALIRLRPLQWACTVQFVRHFAVNGWNFWLPTYLVADKGMTLTGAGMLVALSIALTVPSNFVGGYLSDQLGRPIGVMIGSFLSLALAVLLLTQATSLFAIVVVVSLVGIVIQLSFGPSFAYPVKVIGPRSAGFVSGVSNTCANVGGLLSAYGLGAIKDATGSFSAGLYAMSALCLLGVGCALMLGRSGEAHMAADAVRTTVAGGSDR